MENKQEKKNADKAKAGKIGGSRNTAAQQEQRKRDLHGGGAVNAENIKTARERINNYMKGRTPPAYIRPDIIAWRLADYIATARRTDRPLTETGLLVALGVDDTVFKAYANGERDYLQETDVQARETDAEVNIAIEKIKNKDIDGDIQALVNYLYPSFNDNAVPLMSDCIQKARLLVTLEREERLAISGKVSDIFTMKAREGWQDERTINNNILQITTSNASEALQLLGYKQITDE